MGIRTRPPEIPHPAYSSGTLLLATRKRRYETCSRPVYCDERTGWTGSLVGPPTKDAASRGIPSGRLRKHPSVVVERVVAAVSLSQLKRID